MRESRCRRNDGCPADFSGELEGFFMRAYLPVWVVVGIISRRRRFGSEACHLRCLGLYEPHPQFASETGSGHANFAQLVGSYTVDFSSCK